MYQLGDKYSVNLDHVLSYQRNLALINMAETLLPAFAHNDDRPGYLEKIAILLGAAPTGHIEISLNDNLSDLVKMLRVIHDYCED